MIDKLNPIGEDGVDFINIYSKGKTEVGRELSNWALHPINISIGKFSSIEGLIFFLGSFDDDLRGLYGFYAKQLGEKRDREIRLPEDVFRGYIIEAMKCIAPNIIIGEKLPLVHYYEYGGKRIVPKKWLWQVELWEKLLYGS